MAPLPDEARRWQDDLLYLLNAQAIHHFEVQCHLPSSRTCGLRYEVDDTGNLLTDDDSGGVDAYLLPQGTIIRLGALLREDRPHPVEIDRELRRRGWGAGQLLTGPSRRDRTYSRAGYGLARSHIGTWDEEDDQ